MASGGRESGDMVKYGLIGRRLGHSFSARYFNEKFAREGVDARYDLYEIESIGALSVLIDREPELRGLNVTIPYKQEIISTPGLDFLSEAAREIGAVNTVKIVRDNNGIRLEGHNTDAIGFGDSLGNIMANRPEITKALILGAGGGAAKAVEYVLRNRFGMEVTGVSRHAKDRRLSYSDLTPEIVKEHHLIVNCTPLGMWPDTDKCPEIPYQGVTEHHIGFDLVYNPEETLFMKRMTEPGAICCTGLEMLHGQAEASWKIWKESI